MSRARWTAAPAPEPGRFLRVAPDLCVQILAGSTKTRDRGEKRAIYGRNAVGEYWLIDAFARTLTILVLRDGCFDQGRTCDEEAEVGSAVLPGLRFTVRALFP